MATTPNFGWVMPDPTDFVTNLPADFEVFGDDVDADVWAIKGTADAAISKTIVDAAGDLIYGTANDTVTRLGIGTAGQVLTVNSGATAPQWATAASGGMTLIATVNASTAADVTFSSIPSTYKHLLLVWAGVYHSTLSGFEFVRFNGDTGGNYTYHVTYNSAAGAYVFYDGELVTSIGNAAQIAPVPPTNTSSGVANANGLMWIYNYAQSSQPIVYTYESRSKYVDNSNQRIQTKAIGNYTGFSAINEVKFVRNSTQTVNGQFLLYGVS